MHRNTTSEIHYKLAMSTNSNVRHRSSVLRKKKFVTTTWIAQMEPMKEAVNVVLDCTLVNYVTFSTTVPTAKTN